MAALRGARLWAIAGVLLAVVLTAAAYLLVISPARAQVATVRSQVDDATVQQTVLRHRLHDLDVAAGRMADLDAQLAAAAQALPATADTQGLLRRLQAVASAGGAAVDHVTVRAAVPSSVAGVWAVPVDLSLVGPADALLGTLAGLQSGDGRLVTVSSTTLEPTEGGNFHLTLVMRVYATTAAGSGSASDPAGSAGSSGATGATTGAGGGGSAAGVAAPS